MSKEKANRRPVSQAASANPQAAGLVAEPRLLALLAELAAHLKDKDKDKDRGPSESERAAERHLNLMERSVRVEEELKSLRQEFKQMLQSMDKRFEQVDKRFEQMDKRFVDMQHNMDKRFEHVQWTIRIGIGIVSAFMGVILSFVAGLLPL